MSSLSLPSHGVCSQNSNHCIYRCVTKHRKLFKTDRKCNGCTVSLNKIYVNGSLVVPHYYHCAACDIYLCFNCSLKANLSWRSTYRPPRAKEHPYKTPPKLNKNRLKLNALLNKNNDALLSESMAKVIELFGGNKQMLQFIIKHSSKTQIDEIHKIMSKQSGLRKSEHATSLNQFERIPNELITHITGYLRAYDIICFKMTSREHALICLEEMQKVGIRSLSGNYLLSLTNTPCLSQAIPKLASTHRWNKNKIYLSLFGDWGNMYGIDPAHQLIIDCSRGSNGSISHLNSSFHLYRKVHRHYDASLVVDKKKVVIFKNKKFRLLRIDGVEDNYLNLECHLCKILQYFDIIHQKLRVAQYIIHKRDELTAGCLLDYVQNGFIKIDGVDSEWHDELMKTLSQMPDDSSHGKLMLSNDTRRDLKGSMLIDAPNPNEAGWFGWHDPATTCTFQIHPEHLYLDKLKKIRQNDKHFALTVDDRSKSFGIQTIKLMVDRKLLKSCIHRKYESKLSKKEQKLFEPELHSVFDNIDMQRHRVPLIDMQNIESFKARMKTKVFGNYVRTKNITLFVRNRDDLSAYRYAFPGDSCHITFKHPSVDIGDDFQLYEVSIFTPNDCTYPFLYRSTEGIVRWITFKYKKQFPVSAFINDLFETLKTSKDHILYEGIKDLFQFHSSEDGDDCDMMESDENCDKFRYILSDSGQPMKGGHTPWQDEELVPVGPVIAFHNDDASLMNMSVDVQKMNLFIVQNKPIEAARNIRLRVKFLSADKRATNYIFDGLPLIAWINKTDTVQYVINKYLKQSKKMILSCFIYRLTNSNKSIIVRQKWNDYKLVDKVDVAKDLLVFRFRPFADSGIFIPQFPQFTHDFIDRN